MEVHRILYPTDFSPCARQAFGLAVELARRFGAKIHALHVLALHSDLPYDPGFYVAASEAAYDRARQEALGALEALAREPAAAGVEVLVDHRREVHPGAAVVDYAQRHGIDLVVMGTHGRRGPARLLLGSVAEEVLRHCPCPVLTVRERETPGEEALSPAVRQILVPFDFSPPARAALGDGADLAQRFAARLRVLHVLDERPVEEASGTPASRKLAAATQRCVEQLRLRLRDVVDYLAPGVAGTIDVVVGRPADQILRFADHENVDLVVMASHGLTGIKRLLFGSTTEEVLRLAAAPVLVVKPEPFEPAWLRQQQVTEPAAVEAANKPMR